MRQAAERFQARRACDSAVDKAVSNFDVEAKAVEYAKEVGIDESHVKYTPTFNRVRLDKFGEAVTPRGKKLERQLSRGSGNM